MGELLKFQGITTSNTPNVHYPPKKHSTEYNEYFSLM